MRGYIKDGKIVENRVWFSVGENKGYLMNEFFLQNRVQF